MSSTIKTTLIWVAIILIAIGLYNFVERSPTARILDLTEFLDKVKGGEVSDVTIAGSNLTGHLKGNREAFRSTIPSDYGPRVYEMLTGAEIPVSIIPSDPNPWSEALSPLPGVVLMIGSILWLAISAVVLVIVVDLSRFVKRELARISGNPTGA
jgi:cell division protease FtsH